jgi:hypothetical protein
MLFEGELYSGIGHLKRRFLIARLDSYRTALQLMLAHAHPY